MDCHCDEQQSERLKNGQERVGQRQVQLELAVRQDHKPRTVIAGSLLVRGDRTALSYPHPFCRRLHVQHIPAERGKLQVNRTILRCI